jgi:hypothetical protein
VGCLSPCLTRSDGRVSRRRRTLHSSPRLRVYLCRWRVRRRWRSRHRGQRDRRGRRLWRRRWGCADEPDRRRWRGRRLWRRRRRGITAGAGGTYGGSGGSNDTSNGTFGGGGAALGGAVFVRNGGKLILDDTSFQRRLQRHCRRGRRRQCDGWASARLGDVPAWARAHGLRRVDRP